MINKKIKLLSIFSLTPILGTNFFAISSCTFNNEEAKTEWTNVHRFINDRTFTINNSFKYVDEGETWTTWTSGTMWLFYHVNDYTYYALTNNHVTTGMFDYYFNKEYDFKHYRTCFGYQDENGAKGSTPFSYRPDYASRTGDPNQLTILDDNVQTIGANQHFKLLYNTYMNFYYSSRVYRDMSIVKVDFSDYKNNPTLKSRLDRINKYSDSNNNFTLKFDDYSDVNKNKGETIYAGGYPAQYLDSNKGAIYSNYRIKFQSVIFENCKPQIFNGMSDIYYDIWLNNNYVSPDSKIIYADQTPKQDNTDAVWYSPDWVSDTITNGKIPFGSGASGSLAMRASNVNDESTYKATGIYWGLSYYSSPFKGWTHFSPFIFNFGKNLPSGYNFNIINAFMANPETPRNYQMYTC